MTPRLKRSGLTLVLPKQLPVNDSMPVQEHQSWRDLGSVKAGPRLVELSRALNLKHQIASVDILHHEEQPVLWRKQELELAQSEKIIVLPLLGQVQKSIFFPRCFKNIEFLQVLVLIHCGVISFIKHLHFQKPLKRLVMGILPLFVFCLFTFL